MRLRLHSFVPRSRANGPGLRAVLWMQGCTLGCAGCFNPDTHARDGGEWRDVREIVDQVLQLAPEIEGVTLSGGEPLQQIDAVLALLQIIHSETQLSTLLFTGFTFEEIKRMPRHQDLLHCLDVLLAGRYDQTQRHARGLIASANKQAIFLSNRYSQADLNAVPEAEIIVQPDGTVLLSGIEPFTIA